MDEIPRDEWFSAKDGLPDQDAALLANALKIIVGFYITYNGDNHKFYIKDPKDKSLRRFHVAVKELHGPTIPDTFDFPDGPEGTAINT